MTLRCPVRRVSVDFFFGQAEAICPFSLQKKQAPSARSLSISSFPSLVNFLVSTGAALLESLGFLEGPLFLGVSSLLFFSIVVLVLLAARIFLARDATCPKHHCS